MSQIDVRQMDYKKFCYEYDKFDEYMKNFREENPELTADSSSEKLSFSKLEHKHDVNDAWLELGKKNDMIQSPAHYTGGKTEAIDIIEDAISHASSVESGFLQGQVLKYMLRMWLKNNPLEDAKKAQWYLTRLIKQMR